MNFFIFFNICFYSELKMKISMMYYFFVIKNIIYLNVIMYEKKINIVLCKKDFFF